MDLVVCHGRQSLSTADCYSHNTLMITDGCLASSLQGNPGMGPSFTGARTYKIQVLHCMNTKGNCDYGAEAPELPYVISWFTV